MDEIWDCIVIGGGAAGLSAALVMGRARLRTLVLDAGEQSNLPAHGIGGLLGHDGRSPAELYALGRRELDAYPSVEVRDVRVTSAAAVDGCFTFEVDGGTVVRARRVVLAGGMDYRVPHIDGLAERWGRSAFHCPFCHGWEVRDRPLAVLDADPATAAHRALLLRRWSDDVTLLTNGPAALAAEDRSRLAGAGVGIDERPVAALRGPGDDLAAAVFDDGAELACNGVLVGMTLHQRDNLARQLGVRAAPPSPISVEALAVDAMGATAVPGVFVAGDIGAGMPSVANAIAAGSNAGATAVRSLVA
jgi:thioredoxin reductase